MSEAPEKSHRLFVACELSEHVRAAVADLIGKLRDESEGAVRWVDPRSLHVTLKFLGEAPERRIPAIKVALQEAVVRHSPFDLELDGIGMFGGREGLPKIELCRPSLGHPYLYPEDPDIVALATDAPPPPDLALPHLDLNDPPAIADFILGRLPG